MRIVGGTCKGRKFPVPKGFTSRPTTDMARESLMNVLANEYDFSTLEILDLFSGTGAVGYEFASRGAKKIIAVEKNNATYRNILLQVENFGFSNFQVLKKDVFSFLKGPVNSADVIFADPPFNLPGIQTLPDFIFENGWIRQGGCLVLEHSRDFSFIDNKHFSKLKTYGAVNFSFFFVD